MLFLDKYTFLDIIKMVLSNSFLVMIMFVVCIGRDAVFGKIKQSNKEFIKQMKKYFKLYIIFCVLFNFIIFIAILQERVAAIRLFDYSFDNKSRRKLKERIEIKNWSWFTRFLLKL